MGQCVSANAGLKNDQLNGGTALPKYEWVGELGAGRKGEIKLMRNRKSKELVAVKYIARQAGVGLDVNTEREIVNHRKLLHPNIIRYKEVFYDESYLAIVVEYASQGHLSSKLKRQGPLSEDDARRFFQQLIDGIAYCHKEGVVHRNLRMDHLLLDGNVYNPTLKLTGFGFSKSNILDSQPCSNVGTPAYVSPEVLTSRDNKTYDGLALDMWACGVILFYMLTGVLPFQGSSSGPSLLTKKMMDDMASSRFHYPEGVQVSAGARDLIKKILQADPKQRATAAQIQQHPWFLPGYTTPRQLGVISPQTEADITRIVQAARVQPVRSRRHFIEDEIEE